MKIVMVKYATGGSYFFRVPAGVDLQKGDLVRTHRKELDIALCLSDSEEVSDNVLRMIMGEKKVTATITGKYELTEYNNE